MSTLELHPEEMLDAARRGTLTPQGFADLHAHLDRCAACRLSLALGDDLRGESAVTTGDQTLLAQMVRGALAEEPGALGAGPLRASGLGRLARRAAIALGLLLVGGSAGAAIWSSSGVRVLQGFQQRFKKSEHHVVAAAPAPAATPVIQAVPTGPPEAPVVRALPVPSRAHAHVEARPAAAIETADGVFADANRARRAGDYAFALRRYAQLRRQFPGTREEMTARVIVGDLSLTGGSTRDALTSFDSYLAASPDGTLAEEARVGRALALQKLGRRDEEREAWKQLLRRHPDSVQVTRARERLAELGE